MSTASLGSFSLKRVLKPSVFLVLLTMFTGCGATHVGGHALNNSDLRKSIANRPVVFIGDSITHNWADPQYSNWFAEEPMWNNQGIVGQNSSQLMLRFNVSVVNFHPQIVHILTGTNDVYPGWELCGGSAVFDTCDNIKAMVQMAQQAGIQPILATIPPWGCDEPNCALAEEADGSAARYDRIDTLNSWIKSYGAQEGITLVDYHSALVSVDGQTYVPDYTVDGVHPSAAGYDIMTPLVQAAIQAQGQK